MGGVYLELVEGDACMTIWSLMMLGNWVEINF